jgi:hypothetical protein
MSSQRRRLGLGLAFGSATAMMLGGTLFGIGLGGASRDEVFDIFSPQV